MSESPLNRRSFIASLAALPAVMALARSSDPAAITKTAEKSYDAIIEWLKSDEWQMGNGQCHECCGLAPDGTVVGHPSNSYVTSWGSGHGDYKRDTGHAPECKLAMSLELLGSPVKWATANKL